MFPVLRFPLLVLACIISAPLGFCHAVHEDAGTFIIEHTATLSGQFRDTEVWIPVPLNWPQQTVSDVTIEPPEAEFILDDSRTVALAVLAVPGPATEASLTVRYTVKCHPPRFDAAALAARDYPPYDPETDDYRRFTSPCTHIESDDPDIVALGERFRRAEEHPVRRARAIYDHVIDICRYEDGPGRGARAMLQRRAGSCVDFAQLFAAICRAAGIPARECAGFIAGRDDNWHSWAEFLLPEVGWVPCDPQVGGSRDGVRDDYFGALKASPYVVVAKLHDFTVTRDGKSRTAGFIQSGLVAYRGTCEVKYSLTSTTATPVRYAVVLAASAPRAAVGADMTEEELLARDAEEQAAGRRCVSLAVAPGPAGLAYGAVWAQGAAGERSQLCPRLSLDQYRALLTQARQARMMPVSLASCVADGEAVYAAAFGEDRGAEWAEASGLAQEAFMERLRAHLQAGRAPVALTAHQEHGGPVCSGVFAPLDRPAAVSLNVWLSGEQLAAELDRYRREGLFPTVLSATAGFPPHFHVVGVSAAQGPAWQALSGLTGEEVLEACASAAGLRPVSITAY